MLKLTGEVSWADCVTGIAAIAALFWQVRNHVIGVDVEVFPSPYVYMFVYEDKLELKPEEEGDTFPLVLFVLPMNYANWGAEGNNAVVREEFVRFNVGDYKFHHQWRSLVSVTASDLCDTDGQIGPSKTKRGLDPDNAPVYFDRPFELDYRTTILNCNGNDDKLVIEERKDPLAIGVEAGRAVQHETFFYPVSNCVDPQGNPKPNNLCKDSLNNLFEWNDVEGLLPEGTRLDLVMGVKAYGLPPRTASCSIHFTRLKVKVMRQFGWAKFDCIERKDLHTEKRRRARPA